MEKRNYPIAEVSKDVLTKIQQFENDLKKEGNEDIILIAYQKERS